ncbi:MAG TPA: class I SAM-dependent methyltransferase [Solirubrobacteraceae bacterium]|nr:class I SAM-dependent methyltransferase [Solirubrobacteraceae bacterium]
MTTTHELRHDVVINGTDGAARGAGQCRSCGSVLRHTVVDLGMSPLCESYVSREQLDGPETFYPLHVLVCETCFLVQLQQYVPREAIFTEYAYFSSYSDSWLAHARRYTEEVTRRFNLGATSRVVEIASNDGYLLQYFVERGIPALGVEPAANVARVAREKGVRTRVEFFGCETARVIARDEGHADLLIGNNVLAQVHELNDFIGGLKILLAPEGVITIEFPHLMRLVAENQFDTIYHEHFSYFSLFAVEWAFGAHGLVVFDVEELPTHGGSLRIFACHAGEERDRLSDRVAALRAREAAAGVNTLAYYASFEEQVRETKRRILEFLISARREGRRVVGYGAPGKGNTLLNYCGIRTDFLEYTVDRNPYKQGKYLPGTHIPILAPEAIRNMRPDYVFVLPWNLRDEIVGQLGYIRKWNGRFVVPIPTVEVV